MPKRILLHKPLREIPYHLRDRFDRLREPEDRAAFNIRSIIPGFIPFVFVLACVVACFFLLLRRSTGK